MLKFSTFTGSHNNRETEGEERNRWSNIGATRLGRCRGATDCPE